LLIAVLISLELDGDALVFVIDCMAGSVSSISGGSFSCSSFLSVCYVCMFSRRPSTWSCLEIRMQD